MREVVSGPLIGPSAVLRPAVAVRPMAVPGSAGSAAPGGVNGFWQCWFVLGVTQRQDGCGLAEVDVLPCMGVGGGRWTRDAKSARAQLHTSRGSLSLCDERVQARVRHFWQIAKKNLARGECVTRGAVINNPAAFPRARAFTCRPGHAHVASTCPRRHVKARWAR